MNIFLSGDTRSGWQDKVIKRFPNCTFFDPRTVSGKSYEEMARIERDWVNQSDIVFAYLSKTNPYGYGTTFEIGYALANKKAIIYVDEKQVSSSKWIGEHPLLSYDNLKNGLNKLEEYIKQGNAFIANSIVASLYDQDFTVLIYRELDDKLVTLISNKIYDDDSMYPLFRKGFDEIPILRGFA